MQLQKKKWKTRSDTDYVILTLCLMSASTETELNKASKFESIFTIMSTDVQMRIRTEKGVEFISILSLAIGIGLLSSASIGRRLLNDAVLVAEFIQRQIIFQGLMETNTKVAVFCDVDPCILILIDVSGICLQRQKHV
jgi:hypothetical protein